MKRMFSTFLAILAIIGFLNCTASIFHAERAVCTTHDFEDSITYVYTAHSDSQHRLEKCNSRVCKKCCAVNIVNIIEVTYESHDFDSIATGNCTHSDTAHLEEYKKVCSACKHETTEYVSYDNSVTATSAWTGNHYHSENSHFYEWVAECSRCDASDLTIWTSIYCRGGSNCILPYGIMIHTIN